MPAYGRSRWGRRFRLPHLPLIEIHPAHAGCPAWPSRAGTCRSIGGLACSVGVGGEGGVLLLEALLAAGGAFNPGRVGGAAHQLLKLRSAFFAKVFVDWHGGYGLLYCRGFGAGRARGLALHQGLSGGFHQRGGLRHGFGGA